MGAEQSSSTSADDKAPLEEAPGDASAENAHQIDVNTLQGYRCMKVFRGGPAARAGLTAFEDFIVAVDGLLVDGDGALSASLSAAEGKPVQLSVWNCVDAAERCVSLTPARWPGGPGLLGAAVRFEHIKGALDFCWRVIDVVHRSPADDAGLVPRSDYIVGTPAEVFRSTDAFSNMVRYFPLSLPVFERPMFLSHAAPRRLTFSVLIMFFVCHLRLSKRRGKTSPRQSWCGARKWARPA